MPLRTSPYMQKTDKQASTRGFTIVELLIVIVVIAILAAITIVAYNGIRQRAVASALQADLSSASKALKLDLVRLGGYPSAITPGGGANNGAGISFSGGAVSNYYVDGDTYCLELKKNSVSYYITESAGPVVGTCAAPEEPEPPAPVVPPYAAKVLEDNPAAFWRFQNTTGTTVADASGNNRPLTQSNATGIGAAGLSTDPGDLSWNLPGTTGAGITYGSAPEAAWQHGAPFTVEAIIQPAAVNGYRGIVSHDGSSVRSWSLYIIDGKLAVFDFTVSGSGFALSNQTLQVNRRYHVAMTYVNNTVQLYINGVADGSRANTTLRTTSAGRPLMVGASWAGGGSPNFPFSGRIDEVAFYQAALPQARILAHARAAGF